MLDSEVDRLRRLRAAALRLRALAGELGRQGCAADDPLLARGAHAAWRVVRMVTGRLRAHPFVDFQRDAGLGLLLRNSIAAKVAAYGASGRLRVLETFDKQLRIVCRQLADARALAWDRELSDSLGRSQLELSAVAAAAEHALSCAGQNAAGRDHDAPISNRARIVARDRAAADWPFVAL